MAAGKWNFTIEQGATFVRQLTYSDNTKKPIDLTGFTAKLQIRKSAKDPLLMELSTENGRITLGTTNGSIRLSISADDTRAIKWLSSPYALELTSASGVVIRLLQGTATASPHIIT